MSWTITVPSVTADGAGEAIDAAVAKQLADEPTFAGGAEETLMHAAASSAAALVAGLHAEHVSVILEGRDQLAVNVRIAAAPAPIPVPVAA